MPSGWTVTTKSDRLDSILSRSRSQAGKVIRKVGRNALKYIKELEPYKTGNLRNETRGEEGTLLYRIMIGGKAYYWRFLNDGTRYIPAKYFVEEGVNRALAEMDEDLKQFGRRIK